MILVSIKKSQFMKQNLGFFASLSLGINGLKHNHHQNSNSPSILPEYKARLLQSLNHHQSLFEKIDNFHQNYGVETQLNPETLKEEYSRLYAQFQQEIEKQHYLLSTQHQFAARYEKLFNKYDQKLKDPNLSQRQRMRYQKLWVQYSMLYGQYCDR